VYSSDYRLEIVRAYESKQGSIRGLARRYKVSPSTVYQFLRRWRETGAVGQPEYRHGPLPKILDDQLDQVEAILREAPGLTLAGYAELYSERYGVIIRRTAFRKALLRAKKRLALAEAPASGPQLSPSEAGDSDQFTDAPRFVA
jgi:transposase